MMVMAKRRKRWDRPLAVMLAAALVMSSFALTGAPQEVLAADPEPAPGGIDKRPVLWLKANDGVTVNEGKLTDWIDQAGVNTFTLEVPSGQEEERTPKVKEAGVNFNPAITFNNPNFVNHWGNSGKLVGDKEIEIASGYIVYHWNHNQRLGTIVGSDTVYGMYGRSFFSGYSQGGGAYRLTVNGGIVMIEKLELNICVMIDSSGLPIIIFYLETD